MQNFKLTKISDVEIISQTILNIKDVAEGLKKRVDLSEYFSKLSEFAENYILQDNGNTVAFASMYANDMVTKTAYITLIACNNTNRGKGYGGKMFDFLINEAKENGMKKLKLEVDRDNSGAIAFYKKFGLDIIGYTENGYLMETSI